MDKVIIEPIIDGVRYIYSEKKYGVRTVFKDYNTHESVMRQLIEEHKDEYEIEVRFDEDFYYYDRPLAKKLRVIFAEYVKDASLVDQR